MFKQLEAAALGTDVALDDVLNALTFNSDGLIPAIAQDASSQQVLMVAWMDRTSERHRRRKSKHCAGGCWKSDPSTHTLS